MTRTPELARRFFDRFEPLHAVTYFSPEARAEFDALGYRGFFMGYFAGRSAPLGEVPPEVVTALFYNFSQRQVRRALPDAWSYAPPAAALEARVRGAAAALRRCGLRDNDAGVRRAAELLHKAATGVNTDGRALAAANAAVAWPDEPVSVLWQAATLLREHRGDGHVAALVAAGIGGRESNVLQVAAGKTPREFFLRARDYDDAQWRHHEQRLAARGLLDDSGVLTAAGREVKADIERRTDTVALPGLAALGDAEVEELFGTLTPLTRLVVAAGDVPAATPMGLGRDDLDDDSAGLG
ncbi:hypothetical protein LV457_13885 [Mycobacterium sp. MYCO198283]|uniref:SCO6745 family protein n=1 Tax=Mycobacterium sp. MYCO198283 TaxID=2883505 RepID=UPI001E61F8DC|nr:hypothetical protein [Mycobacterium sp. MYCO198283]MCG5433368.1 hypothetical protein [Mycobacterium sp. MYCO198283]